MLKGRSRQSGGPEPIEHDHLAAIRDYAASRSLEIESVADHSNHWWYWLRGMLFLSNLSRVYILLAKSADGHHLEIHLAFDPLAEGKSPRAVLERANRAKVL